jgi:hypothetical protein
VSQPWSECLHLLYSYAHPKNNNVANFSQANFRLGFIT